MNPPRTRRTTWPRWVVAVATVVIAAGTQPAGQSTGAAARPAPEPPLLVLSPKAKSPGWTGVHRPHTRLRDVLARHALQHLEQQVVHPLPRDRFVRLYPGR